MPIDIKVGNLAPLLPVLIVLTCALAMVLLDALSTFGKKPLFQASLGVFATLASLVLSATFFPYTRFRLFGGALVADGFSAVVGIVVLVLLLLVIPVSERYFSKMKIKSVEYFPLLLFSAAGMMLLPMAQELVSIIVCIEILSVPLYILSGYNKHWEESKEAGFKYFLLGAFSSAFMIYGSALIYGSAGSVWLKDISLNLPLVEEKFILFLGLGLLLVGFLFKLAIVPFHAWVPDVYEGAPSPVVGFMAGAVKIALLSALLRLLFVGFILVIAYWEVLFFALAILTMSLANLWALHQMSLKRLLAYSSIAHIGFISIGFTKASSEVAVTMLFYAITYAIAVLGAFAVISAWAHSKGDDIFLDDVQGLSEINPISALLLTIFLLSLAGIPVTAGFLAKFYLFYEVYRAGGATIVTIAILNSIISIYYYVRVIGAMYFPPAVFRVSLSGTSSFSAERQPLSPASNRSLGSSADQWGDDKELPLKKLDFPIMLASMTCAILVILLGVAPKLLLLMLSFYRVG